MWEQDKWSWVKEDGGSVLTLMIVHISRSAAVIYIQLSGGGVTDSRQRLRVEVESEGEFRREGVCVCMHVCLGGWAVGGESCICSQPQSAALKALSLNNGPHQCRERSHRHKCTQ